MRAFFSQDILQAVAVKGLMFYVNDEPEGKFLYTETKLYRVVYCIASVHSVL